MSKRLNIERQQQLEPERIKYAKEQIEKLGYEITYECDTRIDFIFKGSTIQFYPYSGWHTGKTIIDGRGINKLINQIKNV